MRKRKQSSWICDRVIAEPGNRLADVLDGLTDRSDHDVAGLGESH